MSGHTKATRKRQREEFKAGKPTYHNRHTRPPMTVVEVRAYLDALPPDDRTPMQRLLGEPPSWRSALAQRQLS